MSDIVIEAEGLSKCYLIPTGEVQGRYRTLRETLARGVSDFASRISGGSATKTDREFWALRDVSFRIARGERVGIIGANGAGKSTLLKLLSRIVAPTRGRARVRGRLSALLEVGTGFHPELTGAENIRLNAALLGMSSVELSRVYDAIVDFSGVSEHLNVPVKRYSSGMYTRLAFAVAAHLEPDILVVDEVLAVGDAAFQRKSIERMKALNQTGQTLLCVSHNMGLLSSLCSSALVLDKGRIVYPLGPITGAIKTYNDLIAGGGERDLAAPSVGAGKLRIRSVYCGSTPATIDATVETGASLYIRVNVVAADRLVIGDPFEVTVSFVNSYGHLVGFSDSAHWNEVMHTKEDGASLLFEVKPFYFGPGAYHLNVALTRKGDLEDAVFHAIFFTVIMSKMRKHPMHVPNGIECDLPPLRLISSESLLRKPAS